MRPNGLFSALTQEKTFDMSLHTKVSALFSILAVILVTGITWLQYASASASLERATYDRLTALRESKRQQIEVYFAALRRDLDEFAMHSDIVEAAQEMGAAFGDSWGRRSLLGQQMRRWTVGADRLALALARLEPADHHRAEDEADE